ncbi:hypothetical protein [Streptomyces colonosanans]|uniref:Lipoprotein n=1 Tax=Streptomyces colonosanans TaxID=1428652 RepID=A0A1S2PBN0_9ACTN|nr:hypothetical protein [Streptomyces colonosanans]OIJ91249.1 hypothetical protein BIV24_16885 [Streptomyces colonosanans]
MTVTHGLAIATTCTATAATAALLFSSGTAAWAEAGDGLSPQQLAAKAREGLRETDSVRLSYVDRSPETSSNLTRPAALDLALDRSGNCTGIMTMGAHGGTVKMVKHGGDVWLKPDETFWKAELPGQQGTHAAQVFKNRYIHGPASDPLLKGVAAVCDLKALQRGATASQPRSLKEGAETTLNGTRVIPLTSRTDTTTSTLYVTAQAPHRLYRAATKGPGTDFSLTFTDYGKPVSAQTPPASQSLDVSKYRAALQET